MESSPEKQEADASADSVLPIALCADANFYEGLETAVCSALVSSRRTSGAIRFYVVDGGLEESQKRQLEGHVARLADRHAVQAGVIWKEPDREGQAVVKAFKGHPNAYARLFLVNLIPEEEWVVWMDADLFCMKDLNGVERYLEDKPVAAVVDRQARARSAAPINLHSPRTRLRQAAWNQARGNSCSSRGDHVPLCPPPTTHPG